MNFSNNSKTDSPPTPVAATNTSVADGDTFDVSGSKKSSLAIFICWTVAFLSIAGSVFFWLLNSSAEQAIKTKSDEKQQIINEISSPSLSDTEVRATSFKSVVNQLSSVSKNRYSMDTFLTKFYGQVAQNVKVINISVTFDGKISLSGSTDSYRAVADQMMLFKDWKVNNANILRDVKLASVTETLNDATKKVQATFLIVGSIDKTQTLIEKPKETLDTQSSTTPAQDSTSVSSADTSSDLNNTGGSNASVQ